MFCQKCGSQNRENGNFCVGCGASLQQSKNPSQTQPNNQQQYATDYQNNNFNNQPQYAAAQNHNLTEEKAKQKKVKNKSKSNKLKISLIALVSVCFATALVFAGLWFLNSNSQTEYEIYYQEVSSENIAYDEELEAYYVNNQILITANEGVSKSEIEDIISEYDGEIVGYIEITNDYQVELSGEMTLDELDEIIEELASDNDISSVYIHELFETSYAYIPSDSEYAGEDWYVISADDINWGLEAIDAMGAWAYLEQMQTVKVGVIDSFFDVEHEDLDFEEVFLNPDELIYDENSTSSYNYYAHGTHVSGILAANVDNEIGISGVASNVELYGYAFFGDNLVDSQDNEIVFNTYFEFKYALANLIVNDCKVINVSMSCSGDLDRQAEVYGEFLYAMLNKGYDFVIVQAAGNDSTDTLQAGLFTGIEIDEVKDRIIVVGAIGVDDSYSNLDDTQTISGYYFAEFSNYNERVDVVAPGVDIYSTVPNSEYEDSFEINGKTISWSGTSMAAPYVSGIAALCYSVNPDLTGDQIKDIVVNSYTTTVTKVVSSLESYNYPLVNASLAVEAALSIGDGEEVEFEDNTVTGIVMGAVLGNCDDVIIACGVTGSYMNNYSTTDSEGNFELILKEGVYDIIISSSGYTSITLTNVEVIENEILYLDDFVLTENDSSQENGMINGYVYLTDVYGSLNALSDVEITLSAGWDYSVQSGIISYTDSTYTTTTDENGYYCFEDLPKGCYTAQFVKDGYITEYVYVVCADAGITVEYSVSIDIDYTILEETLTNLFGLWSYTDYNSGDTVSKYFAFELNSENGEYKIQSGETYNDMPIYYYFTIDYVTKLDEDIYEFDAVSSYYDYVHERLCYVDLSDIDNGIIGFQSSMWAEYDYYEFYGSDIESGIEQLEEEYINEVGDWQAAYLKYIEETNLATTDSLGDSYRYPYARLVCIDDDNIPELILQSSTYAYGSIVCTYSNGVVVEQYTNQSVYFIEGTGLIYAIGGHMGYYTDIIYKLENGIFTNIFNGYYAEVVDTETYTILGYRYHQDDFEYSSEDEYESAINEIFDTDNAIGMSGEYDSDLKRYVAEGLYDYDGIIQAITDY